jgi:hypothetical protein
MASKINLISNALILIGDLPINSLTGNTRAQQVASNLYDNIVQNELTKTRWGFARKKERLALTTIIPVDDQFSSVYQLPSDLLALTTVRPNGYYQLYGDKLHTNHNGALTADYQYDAPESEWPAYFAKMVEYALAKDFATSIRDSSASRQEMSNEYVIASRMARFTDAQQYPQTAIAHRPFIEVRS